MQAESTAPWREVETACKGHASRFAQLLAAPEPSQRAFLGSLIARNSDTQFGSDFGFHDIRSYGDFAARVPVATYEGFRPYIERILQGSERELSADPVLFVELTGGSTGGSKVIPYTQGSLDAYSRALTTWIAGLLEGCPKIAGGRAYFAVSPVGRAADQRMGAVPIGSADQFGYLGGMGDAVARLSVVPLELALVEDFEAWQFATCLHLLTARDLSLIWVWSPTYLSELLQVIMRKKRGLLEALGRGSTIAAPLPSQDPLRAAQLATLIGEDRLDTAQIWPNLQVISCWMDGSSAPFAAQLRTMFPHVTFQAKGLMATEGATTLPFGQGAGAPLAIESGFFEFADESGAVWPAWELERGDVRRVILSNHSGLYRYDTQDLVEVVGFEGATPRLRFLGRVGGASDICGEKLTEAFVLRAIEQCIGPGLYAFLAPRLDPHPHYELWIDGRVDAGELNRAAEAIDTALGGNPQYIYARKLGQLGPVAAWSSPGVFEQYQLWSVAQGRNVGALKARALLELPADFRALLRTGVAPNGAIHGGYNES